MSTAYRCDNCKLMIASVELPGGWHFFVTQVGDKKFIGHECKRCIGTVSTRPPALLKLEEEFND